MCKDLTEMRTFYQITPVTRNLAGLFELFSLYVRVVPSKTIQLQVAVSLGVIKDQITMPTTVSEKKDSRIGLLEGKTEDPNREKSRILK